MIPEVGDGGPTTVGFKKCYNPATKEIRVVPEVPEGWVRGPGIESNIKGKIRCHNPETGRNLMVMTPEDIPDGWKLGGMKGHKYGPVKGSIVCHNQKGTKKYLNPGEKIPDGWVRGSGHYTSRGRIACFCPLTKRKKFVKSIEAVPAGWAIGQLPTTGKCVITPDGTFESIKKCMDFYSITRTNVFKNCKEKEDWILKDD